MPVPFLAVAFLSAPVAATAPAPIAIAAPAPLQQNAAGIRAFLQSIYAGYRKGGHGARLGQPELYFEPLLARAIRKDAAAAAAAGDMGKMDVDPFCDCQDFGTIVPTIQILGLRGQRALAKVGFRNLGTQTWLRYDLVWTAKGWRIYDIDYGEGAALRRAYLN